MSGDLKISIIVPCFNMEQYVKKTIDSIISQGFENLELIVVDGGSTDNTVEIIRDYDAHITHFLCEPDEGQYDAINKGFSLATGDVVAWLNADDLYFPWTLYSVNQIFFNHPDILWICGTPSYTNDDMSGVKVCKKNGAKVSTLIQNGSYRSDYLGFLQQESMFWRKDLLDAAGHLALDYKLAADFEYWTRLAKHAELHLIDFPLACFRLRHNSRSVVQITDYEKEVKKVLETISAKKYWYSRLLEANIFTRYVCRIITFGRVNVIQMNLKSRQLERFTQYRNVSNYSISELFFEAVRIFKLTRKNVK